MADNDNGADGFAEEDEEEEDSDEDSEEVCHMAIIPTSKVNACLGGYGGQGGVWVSIYLAIDGLGNILQEMVWKVRRNGGGFDQMVGGVVALCRV